MQEATTLQCVCVCFCLNGISFGCGVFVCVSLEFKLIWYKYAKQIPPFEYNHLSKQSNSIETETEMESARLFMINSIHCNTSN